MFLRLATERRYTRRSICVTGTFALSDLPRECPMTLRNTLLSASAVLALALPALAEPPGPPPGAPPGCAMPPGGPMHMLSPEQRMMMMADADKATADGSLSMEDYRSMQRDKMKAMTPEQRDAFFAGLTARYNALPAAEKAALKAKAAQRMAEHRGGPDGQGPGGPGGPGGKGFSGKDGHPPPPEGCKPQEPPKTH